MFYMWYFCPICNSSVLVMSFEINIASLLLCAFVVCVCWSLFIARGPHSLCRLLITVRNGAAAMAKRRTELKSEATTQKKSPLESPLLMRRRRVEDAVDAPGEH